MTEWINKIYYIYTMEFPLVFKGKEILTYTTCMNFEDMVNKINQFQRNYLLYDSTYMGYLE